MNALGFLLVLDVIAFFVDTETGREGSLGKYICLSYTILFFIWLKVRMDTSVTLSSGGGAIPISLNGRWSLVRGGSGCMFGSSEISSMASSSSLILIHGPFVLPPLSVQLLPHVCSSFFLPVTAFVVPLPLIFSFPLFLSALASPLASSSLLFLSIISPLLFYALLLVASLFLSFSSSPPSISFIVLP